MSKRNKLQKFSDLLSFPNVYENRNFQSPQLEHLEGQIVDRKGRWAEDHFGNTQGITLELACGGGEYTYNLAERYKDRNFIGVDIKGARIWKGATYAMEHKLDNVAFVRTQIEQLDHFFAPEEVEEIWITFPDPFLRESKSNKRLTSNGFLDLYKKIIKKGGILQLKTDSTPLYEFTLETLSERKDVELFYQNDDIYASELVMDELHVKTHYEKMHLQKGLKIKFLRFRFTD